MTDSGIVLRAAMGLRLAAAPTFGLLALLTSGSDADICMHIASPLWGMNLMYGLMTLFHLGPWLHLLKLKNPM